MGNSWFGAVFTSLKKKLFLTVLILLSPAMALAATSTVNLAWDANVEADLAGYRLYQSTAAGGPYTLIQTLGKVTTTSVTALVDGRYYWVLTAFDAAGNESGYSNEVTFLGDTAPPSAPATLRVTTTVVTK